jgi:tetratricopeptide (TPR) repeat protein
MTRFKTILSGGNQMRLNRVLIMLVSAFFLVCSSSVLSTSNEYNEYNVEHVFVFADHLELTGDFYRAITEYRRLVFHWPEHPLASESRYRIGRSYMLGKDYRRATETFQNLLADSLPSFDHRRLRYALAQSYFYSDFFYQADQQLMVLESYPLSENAPSLRYARLWCHLKPGHLENALDFWTHATDANMDQTPDPDAIRGYLQNMADQSRKNPHLAGWLSAAIPGLGQVYAGRPRNALMSFLLNGLFISAITMAIDKGHYETAAVLGFFEIGFYTANIYNAINDAHKTNREQFEHNLIHFEYTFGPPFSSDYAPFNP